MAAALGQRFVHFALPAVPHSTLEVNMPENRFEVNRWNPTY